MGACCGEETQTSTRSSKRPQGAKDKIKSKRAEAEASTVPTEGTNVEMVPPEPEPEVPKYEDLPAVNYERISDPLAKMEASLPFNRINVVDMNVAIEEASFASGEGPFVTLKNLRKSLPTDAWAALEDKQSSLCKVILSPEFGAEETDSDDPKINADYLKMWALLHCKGDNKEKAVAFYEIL